MSIPERDLAVARTEGYQAWLDGVSLNECPYENPSFENEWCVGWCQKMEEVEHKVSVRKRLTKQEKKILWQNRDLMEPSNK